MAGAYSNVELLTSCIAGANQLSSVLRPSAAKLAASWAARRERGLGESEIHVSPSCTLCLTTLSYKDQAKRVAGIVK